MADAEFLTALHGESLAGGIDIVEDLGAARRLQARHGFGQRLALFGGHQPGEVAGVGHHQRVPALEDVAARLGGHRGPGREGGGGGGDGGFGLSGTECRDRADRPAIGGVGDGDGFGGGDPFTVDPGGFAQQVGAL